MPPFDGSGGFSAYTPGNPVVTGTTISSTAFNNTIADLCSNGLSFALTKDGQQVPTANIPMGAFRLTGLGAGTASTDAARVSQVQNAAFALLGNVAGTNTITATLTPTLTAYASGQIFTLVPANTTTGAATISIDSIAGGAKDIYAYGAALVGGELVAGVTAIIEYNGARFSLLNPQTASGTWTPIDSSGAGLSFTVNTPSQYIRVYPFVMAMYDITYPVTASGAQATIGGLPFTAQNTTGSVYPAILGYNNTTNTLLGRVLTNSTTFNFTDASGNAATNSGFSAKTIRGVVIYRTA